MEATSSSGDDKLAATKIVAIDKGLGRMIQKGLHETFADVEVITVPEPTDDLEGGITVIAGSITSATVKSYQLLVAGSRGGKYAAQLIQRGIWTGPTLLFSAMSTSECCCKDGVVVVMAHGTNDGINPISRVREDATMGTPGLIKLEEFEGEDHHLASAGEGAVLRRLVAQAIELQSKVDECVQRQKEKERERQEQKQPPKRAAKPSPMSRMALFDQIRANKVD